MTAFVAAFFKGPVEVAYDDGCEASSGRRVKKKPDASRDDNPRMHPARTGCYGFWRIFQASPDLPHVTFPLSKPGFGRRLDPPETPRKQSST
jgi:hypothetical protein